MRLMKRGQRYKPLQLGYDAMVDQHRPDEVRTAVDHAMADSHRANAEFIPQPSAGNAHCCWNVRNRFDRIDAVNQRFVVGSARPQAGVTANTIDLALDLASQISLSLDRKDLELDA